MLMQLKENVLLAHLVHQVLMLILLLKAVRHLAQMHYTSETHLPIFV